MTTFTRSIIDFPFMKMRNWKLSGGELDFYDRLKILLTLKHFKTLANLKIKEDKKAKQSNYLVWFSQI